MAKFNCRRKGCRDVWNAFLVVVAHFAGFLEFLIVQLYSTYRSRAIGC